MQDLPKSPADGGLFGAKKKIISEQSTSGANKSKQAG